MAPECAELWVFSARRNVERSQVDQRSTLSDARAAEYRFDAPSSLIMPWKKDARPADRAADGVARPVESGTTAPASTFHEVLGGASSALLATAERVVQVRPGEDPVTTRALLSGSTPCKLAITHQAMGM